jgi:hypothetical protein
MPTITTIKVTVSARCGGRFCGYARCRLDDISPGSLITHSFVTLCNLCTMLLMVDNIENSPVALLRRYNDLSPLRVSALFSCEWQCKHVRDCGNQDKTMAFFSSRNSDRRPLCETSRHAPLKKQKCRHSSPSIERCRHSRLLTTRVTISSPARRC